MTGVAFEICTLENASDSVETHGLFGFSVVVVRALE